MPARKRLLIATYNAHKTEEFREMLGSSFEVLAMSDLPSSVSPEETGATFDENARIKALAASLNFDGLVLADDSGLEVDSLEGAPGVHSARYAGAGASDADNRAKLIAELGEKCERTARFRCAIAIAQQGEVLAVFGGNVEGVIGYSEKGAGGFGYDSLFIPEGYSQTFAELGSTEKHKLSHRGRAAGQAIPWLNDREF